MRRLTLKDVLAATAIAALVGLPVATVFAVTQREVSNRVKCAANLRQMSMALLLYANENRGKYPRTLYEADTAPTWGTPYEGDATQKAADTSDPYAGKAMPKANDVTAAMFLLLRTQDIVAETFICPSSGLKRWEYGGAMNSAQHWTNWNGKATLASHLSYSYANPYPSKAAIATGYKLDNTLTAEFAVLADMNPGGTPPITVTPQAPGAQLRTANSLNHAGDGQNVAYGDGHVEFTSNPFVGVGRDNIYTANGPERERPGAKATIVASPVDPQDSILLPTAADLGQKIVKLDEATLRAMEAADAEQARQMARSMVGTWSAVQRDQYVRLTVTATTFTAVAGPVTIAYSYRTVGVLDGKPVLEFTAPDTEPTLVLASVKGDRLELDPKDGFALPRIAWQRGDQAATRPALRSTSRPTAAPASRPRY